jgi:hypothetical protein
MACQLVWRAKFHSVRLVCTWACPSSTDRVASTAIPTHGRNSSSLAMGFVTNATAESAAV